MNSYGSGDAHPGPGTHSRFWPRRARFLAARARRRRDRQHCGGQRRRGIRLLHEHRPRPCSTPSISTIRRWPPVTRPCPCGTVPLKQFSGNTAMTSNTGSGNLVPPDPDERWTNVDRRLHSVELEVHGHRLALCRAAPRFGMHCSSAICGAFRGYGVNSNHITGDMTFENLHVEGFETGLMAPPLAPKCD